jgi:hypothetical protein
MAKDKTETATSLVPTALPAPIAGPVVTGNEKTLDLATNRAIYKHDDCNTHPVQGWILARLQMPAVGGDREWDCLLMRVTQPTIGKNREGDTVAVNPGDQILIPTNYTLDHDPVIARLADHPELIGQFYFKPLKKIPIGGGKTMWTFDAKLIGEPRKRSEEQRLYLALPPAAALPQFGGNGATANSPPPPF